jgi:alkanesulfonate monooxygenase SsuD/methylene tetrahydromethanopterin reductase-like flavin-dependent oxidoreductase (luciferase family)
VSAPEAPRFGVFLPPIRVTFDDLVERAQTAEELGYDAVWLIDHLWTPGMPEADILEAWTVATALAMRTRRVHLGHMVLCNQFRHPAVLAKMAATLDVVSGGRLELGLGWGSVPDELTAFGVGAEPPARRAGRLRETLEILELLFSGGRVSYAGRYYQLHDAIQRPRPPRGRIPIHIGGAGPRLTMPLVARHADWWNCVSYGVDRLAELMPLAGKARVSVQHPIALVTDPAQRAALEAGARRRFAGWGGLLLGEPAEIAERLAAEVRLGVEAFVLQFFDYGQPETQRLFAREVIPAVRAAAAGAAAGGAAQRNRER